MLCGQMWQINTSPEQHTFFTSKGIILRKESVLNFAQTRFEPFWLIAQTL